MSLIRGRLENMLEENKELRSVEANFERMKRAENGNTIGKPGDSRMAAKAHLAASGDLLFVLYIGEVGRYNISK